MDFKSAPPWQAIDIPSAQLPNGPDKLRKVVDELDVEHAARYQPGSGKTYCNIFVSDVLRAFGLLPQQRMDGREYNANGLSRWFHAEGLAHGWVNADRKTAVDAAARGHLVVLTYDSKTAHSGHIAVLLREGTIAQAGAHNFVGKTIREGFGTLPVEFWIQIHGGKHDP